MSITYQVEEWPDVVEGLKPLLEKSWQELDIFDKERFSLKPGWELYQILYDNKNLHVVTARDNNKLIGYYVSIISFHMHHIDTLVADNDSLYLLKEYRKGLTGYKLIKFAVEQLKSIVEIIVLSTNAKQAFLPLANRLGFRLTDYRLVMEV